MIKGGYQIIDLSKIIMKFPTDSSPPITQYNADYLYDAINNKKVKLFSGLTLIVDDDKEPIIWEDMWGVLVYQNETIKRYHLHIEPYTHGNPISQKCIMFTLNHTNKKCTISISELI